MTHSITLNGVKSTLLFDDNNWKLTIEMDKNKASICGTISYKSS